MLKIKSQDYVQILHVLEHYFQLISRKMDISAINRVNRNFYFIYLKPTEEAHPYAKKSKRDSCCVILMHPYL